MGFGLGRKRRIRANGDGVKPIDRPIGAIDRPISGVSGVKGKVGRRVKPIDRKLKGADDIFDVKF